MEMENFDQSYSQTLNRFPIGEMKWVRDLVVLDGPLLSEYETTSTRNGEKNTYLAHWCDCDDNFDRWMFFSVTPNALVRLLVKNTTLRELIDKSLRENTTFLDRSRKGLGDNYWAVSSQHIPEEYIPYKDSFVEADDFTGITEADFISVLFDGQWDLKQISKFLNIYRQLYDFLSSVANDYIQRADKLTWQGGYNAVAFFRNIELLTPRAIRASERSITASSPGLMQVSVSRPVADGVIQALKHYDTNKRKIVKARRALKAAITKKELYAQESAEIAIRIFESDPKLLKLRKEFIGTLGLSVQESKVSDGRNSFESAKIFIAYEKRLSNVYGEIEKEKNFMLAQWEIEKTSDE